ncbi:MAG: flavodoxin-dependent (E)-4-hydroxy-3-methylbut-2-enyl-diphosphate synthase [Defluviitaleaceae bacterium]|nr:flavodoxin-dependent (E)-4-hydroxy-3-methylbut-2-enyl-diphosphate synthase [Defluviitaleaceae bacterium]
MIKRKKTKLVNIGDVKVGGFSDISIQSMTNTDTRDVKKTVAQIKALEDAGCEIIRVAIPDLEAAEALKEIKKQIKIPLAADIHFDYRLALKSIENGVDKLRLNPGNIGDKERIRQVVEKAKERSIPIRIGVNSGSIEKHILEKYKRPTAEAMVESALTHASYIEEFGYDKILISLKASSVIETVEAYKMMSEKVDYPLHVGITESGTEYAGSIKSAVGIGAILLMGIGDTVRVSLTCDPVREIICAKEILKSIGIRKFGIEFISCPTCGRTEIDLISLANEVQDKCKHIDKHIKVAIMGCVVNGPGEAREADLGIAGGKGEGIIFKKGEVMRKVPEQNLAEELIKEIEKL